MAEATIGAEILRLTKAASETQSEKLLDEALQGRPKTIETVSKLLAFVVKYFGQEGLYFGRPDLDSIVTRKFGDACSAFLAGAGVDTKTINAIRRPNPVPGDPNFVSVLAEFE